MSCSQLELLLYPTIRLLLYLEQLDVDEFYHVCSRASLSAERAIETKCGNMQAGVSYLLNFSNPIKRPPQFLPNKAYYFEVHGLARVEIQGVTDYDITNTSHGFVLINNGEKWLMLDSYIGCRGFTCRPVILDGILNTLALLREKFNNELWIALTGCSDNNANTDKVDVLMYQYDYSTFDLKSRFANLIELARNRLNNEEVGLSDEYLVLLAADRQQETAHSYLNSLYKLVQ